MKIVLATPLYPPDIAEPAPYAKEAATRLSASHEVVLVTYGHLPEAIPGVRIIAVDKRQPLPFRLTRYFFALLTVLRKADVLYIQNGPSVELPATLASFLTNTPLVMRIGDVRAHARGGTIERMAALKARTVLTDSPLPRPEILPFRTAPDLAPYEASWKNHLATLEATFHD